MHDGHIMETSDALHALRAFRYSLYDECLHRRANALFEFTDAILITADAAPSPAHLSLQASHRRGWGSLYAALGWGRSTPKPFGECSPAIRSLPRRRRTTRLRRGGERVGPLRRGEQPRARFLYPDLRGGHQVALVVTVTLSSPGRGEIPVAGFQVARPSPLGGSPQGRP